MKIYQKKCSLKDLYYYKVKKKRAHVDIKICGIMSVIQMTLRFQWKRKRHEARALVEGNE